MPLYKSGSWVEAYDQAVLHIRLNKYHEEYLKQCLGDKHMSQEEYNKLRAEYLINPNKDFYANHNEHG